MLPELSNEKQMSIVMATMISAMATAVFDSNFLVTSNGGNYGSLLSPSSGGVKKVRENKGSENFKSFPEYLTYHLGKEVSHLPLSNKELL